MPLSEASFCRSLSRQARRGGVGWGWNSGCGPQAFEQSLEVRDVELGVRESPPKEDSVWSACIPVDSQYSEEAANQEGLEGFDSREESLEISK